ncbi:MAG: CapA family protein [Chloroflexaceae bacterium]|nr:CapA family protein [Chloroflexaceae bacterium]
MHALKVQIIVRLLLLTLVMGLLLSSPHQVRALSLGQATDFDSPLMSTNFCGNGQPGDTHFTFAATGDTFPHITIQQVAEVQGYDYLFDHIRPFLQAADVGYTNFDGAMLASSDYTGYPNFNYNPALATALANAGMTLVSTANNHILDRGSASLDATLNVLAEAGIQQHGTVHSSSSERPPYLPLTLTRDRVSITIGFLSFTWGTNGIPDPYQQVNLLWESNDYSEQFQCSTPSRSFCNLLPYMTPTINYCYQYSSIVRWICQTMYPYQVQIDAAQQMAAAGADVLLGAQSHTLQPVDIIDTNGRKTLVMYSLANVLAAQGLFQESSYSNTSIVLYVGIIRTATGDVRVSGYRYLPTMMTDSETRPAPVPAEGYADLVRHVRLKLRDSAGLLQVPADPSVLATPLTICPAYHFPNVSEHTIGGDFAQYVATLGDGRQPRDPLEAIAVLGYPISPVRQELRGDCSGTTSVLYTQRQRLEWQPDEDWPQRVTATQLGTAVYQQRYALATVERLRDIDAALELEPFRAFFHQYGGLHVFGYPISTVLTETDETTGEQKTVQYFERARFELSTGAVTEGNLLDQVSLGLLSEEYGLDGRQCGLVQPTPEPSPPLPGVAVGTSEPREPLGCWPGVMLLSLVLITLAYIRYHQSQRRVYWRRRRWRFRRLQRRRRLEAKTHPRRQDDDVAC